MKLRHHLAVILLLCTVGAAVLLPTDADAATITCPAALALLCARPDPEPPHKPVGCEPVSGKPVRPVAPGQKP